jgi:hypothetical protein
MTKKILGAAAVLLAAISLLSPSGAVADAPPDWVATNAPDGWEPFGADATLAYRMAIDFWGLGEPPLCSEVNGLQAPLLVSEEALSPAGMTQPPSTRESCWILIKTGLDFYETCKAVTHEVGHLFGWGHSEDPSSIMHQGSSTTVIPKCWAEYQRRDYLEELAFQRKSCWQLKKKTAALNRKVACWNSLKRIRARIDRAAALARV